MEDRKVTIADIADALGVSTATVSNVLHGKTKKISDKTVKRVQEKIEEMKYIPNMAAILLAQNNSRIIGIVINDHPKYEGRVLEDGYISSALNGLMKVINDSGYFLMVKTTTDWNDIPAIASMWNMEGIILSGFCEADYSKLRANMHIPFVVYDGYFPENDRIVNLTIDNYDGGYKVGEYLKTMGHKKALCISDNFICMDKDRIEGFRKAFGDDKTDVLQVPMEKKERYAFYEKSWSKVLACTAVFAVSDYYAIDFIQYAKRKGLDIPRDISVVGFDDSMMSEGSNPPLTTVRQDSTYRAKKAVECLKKMRAGESVEHTIALPVTLSVRESVCKRD